MEFEKEFIESQLQRVEEAKAGKNTTAPQSVKLQKYTITLFSGDYKDWLRFWNQFTVEVDGAAISEISKFNYLLVCYTAVFSVVTQRGALRDDTKNGCVADQLPSGTSKRQAKRRHPRAGAHRGWIRRSGFRANIWKGYQSPQGAYKRDGGTFGHTQHSQDHDHSRFL